MEISAIEGDNTAHIQNAIDQMNSFPPDASGIRGALLLNAGLYEIRGTVRLNVEGVLLRGAGDGEDLAANTILLATGNMPHQRDVLIAGSGISSLWTDSAAGTNRDIVSDTVFVGERTFEVTDASPFSIGDNIIIFHSGSEQWLAAIDYGGTFSDEPGATANDGPWEIDSQPIIYNRYITNIEGNTITIDAPVFNTLVRSLSQSYIYKYRRQFLRRNIGIENLRIDIETDGYGDENHAWNGIYLNTLEDGWVRNCTILHFGFSGIYTNTATRITIEDCRALDPVSQITGGRRYNFNAGLASQSILFKGCHASNGRHSFVANGTSSASGVVFLDCTSEGAYAASEGHRRWSQGLLYDNFKELDEPRPDINPRRLALYNRGYFGTSHGWSAAHSVAWNCDVNGGEIHIQKPPTAQNYAIGCFGDVTGQKPPNSFDVPEGYIEGSNMPGLEPQSLFLAQLAERRGPITGIEREQQVGEYLPVDFQLCQNYPNPFNPTTQIRFELYRQAIVTLEVFDISGKLIATLLNKTLSPGKQLIISWNAVGYPTGVYFYRLKTELRIETRKMLLIR